MEPKTQTYRPVGTGAFFGLLVLFMIPVVGFISCIVFSFAPENPNLRHFSRAVLLRMVIGLLIFALLVFLVFAAVSALSGALFAAAGELTHGKVDSFADLAAAVEMLEETLEDYGGMEKLVSDLGELDEIARELGGWDKILEKLSALEETGTAAGDLGSLLEQVQGAN